MEGEEQGKNEAVETTTETQVTETTQESAPDRAEEHRVDVPQNAEPVSSEPVETQVTETTTETLHGDSNQGTDASE